MKSKLNEENKIAKLIENSSNKIKVIEDTDNYNSKIEKLTEENKKLAQENFEKQLKTT